MTRTEAFSTEGSSPSSQQREWRNWQTQPEEREVSDVLPIHLDAKVFKNTVPPGTAPLTRKGPNGPEIINNKKLERRTVMYVFVPDSPQMPYPGMMGQPIPPSEDVRIAKEIIKRDKADRKKKKRDDEERKNKSKPRTFTFLETTAILLFFSIPVTFAQKALFIYGQAYLSGLITPIAPH